MGPMFGMTEPLPFNASDIQSTLQTMKDLSEQVLQKLKDPEITTFVCVCIPEFLSLYETERLVQELTKQDIDTHNLIINQLLFPEEGKWKEPTKYFPDFV